MFDCSPTDRDVGNATFSTGICIYLPWLPAFGSVYRVLNMFVLTEQNWLTIFTQVTSMTNINIFYKL